MATKAGSAYSEYTLDISGLKRGVAEAKRLLSDLQTSVQRIKPQPVGSNNQAQALRQTTQQANAAMRSFEQLDRRYNQVRDSEIRAARAAQDHARALQLVDSALKQTAPDTARYNNLLAQKARIEQAQARSNATPDTSFRGAIAPTLAPIAAAFATNELRQFAVDSIQVANSLEKTKATVLALSGSQERYNQVLQIAEQGQRLYGGTLEENLSGLGSLVNLSNRSGAELSKLDNISRRLAVIDPLQGIEGANIALKEFLTGDGSEAAISLARRFELPKAAIRDLAQEGVSAKDRLAALDKLLNEQGITSEVLTNRTNTNAAAFDQLNASISNLKVAFGDFLAQSIGPTAKDLSQLINTFQSSKTAVDTVKNAVDTASNSIISGIIPTLGVYIQQTGQQTAATDALLNVFFPLKSASEGVAQALDYLNHTVNAGATALTDLENTSKELYDVLIALAGTSNTNKTAAEGLALAYQAGGISAEQVRDVSAQLTVTYNIEAVAVQNLSAHLAHLAEEHTNAGKNAYSNAQIQAAAGAVIDSHGAKTEAAIASLEKAYASRDKTLTQTRAAERDYNFAVANTAGKLSILRSELAKLKPGTADYYKKLTEVRLTEQQLASEREKNSIKGVKAYQSANQQIVDTERSAAIERERIIRDNLERLRDLEENYNVQSTRDQEDFQEQKIKLLAEGKKREAAELEKDFLKKQKRDREDFDRARLKQTREAQERLGDQAVNLANKETKITDRAALKGVTGLDTNQTLAGLGSVPSLPANAGLGVPVAVPGLVTSQPINLQIQVPITLAPDLDQIVNLVAPPVIQRVDDQMSLSIQIISATQPPAAGQVAGLGAQRT